MLIRYRDFREQRRTKPDPLWQSRGREKQGPLVGNRGEGIFRVAEKHDAKATVIAEKMSGYIECPVSARSILTKISQDTFPSNSLNLHFTKLGKFLICEKNVVN